MAVALDAATRQALARVAARLQALGLRGRFVPPENYHVTVAFLGYVDPPAVPGIATVLRATGARTPSLRLTLAEIGAFGSARRPRVAWAGSKKADESWVRLCSSVHGALQAIGVELEEPEAGVHVTLCRCARDAGPLPHADFARRTLQVDVLTLFESRLARDGARYVALEAFALRGESARRVR